MIAVTIIFVSLAIMLYLWAAIVLASTLQVYLMERHWPGQVAIPSITFIMVTMVIPLALAAEFFR